MASNQFNSKILNTSFFLAWMLVCFSSFSEPIWAQVSGKPFPLIETQKDDSNLADTGQSEPSNRSLGGTHARDWDFERDGQSQPENLTRGGSRFNFDGDGQTRSGDRNSGGSRNGGVIPNEPTPESRPPVNNDHRSLTALVPKINLGLTTESHPTFWFYIPEEMANVDEAEFMLLDKDNNPAIDEPIIVELSETPGLVSVSLPATAKSLEVGQEYHWFFALQYEGVGPSSYPTVDGWIQRVEPDPTLTRELNETPDTEDYVIYANHGIWYDALTELIEQYRTQAENPILEADWLALMEAACLEEISATPE